MKKFSILCLLAFMALCGITGCKEDPESINNVPEVFVDEASDLLRTSAVLTGRILAPANAMIREYGFKVSSTSDFTSADTDVYRYSDEESLASFSQQITNLKIGHTYFYVAYATNGLEEMTSTLKTFTTPTRSGATLSEVEVLDLYTPTLKARITDDGGSTITSVGFCWSTSPNPTIFTGEHEFANYDEESQSFTADLTKLKGRENYYVCAFAECDLTGGGNVSISYGETVELKLKFKPTVSLKEVAATAASLTFEITSTDAEEVRWMLLPESSLDLYEEVTAEIVLGSENKVEPNKTEEITVDDLEPETTYTIYAAAEKEGVAVLSQKLEITTAVDSEILKIYYISTDEQIVEPYDATGFGANIVSNTYENGQGVILFDGPVTSIGGSAFNRCNNLTSVTIPDSVTLIDDYAFNGCASLTSVTIPKGVTSIRNFAFGYCTSLTSVTIPDSVTTIGNAVFRNCTGLTSIDISDSVTSIGDSAFSGCSGLTSVTIPNSVTSIGGGAFGGCTGLTSVTIGNGVTSIGGSAFSGCTGLTSVTIPNSVTSIGGGAFGGCTGLTSVTIGNGVTSIGGSAFSGCTGLTSITIPDSVTSIGGGAFNRCTGLTRVEISDLATWCKIDFSTYDSNPLCYAKNLYLNGSLVSDLEIPDSVTSIREWTFYGCTTLTSVSIPDSVTTIGDNAFDGCSSLTNVTIPDSVTSIGEWTFYGCTALTSVTIPNGVTSIGRMVFNNCDGLTSVYCKPTTPPTGGSKMFESNASGRKIYVPNASVNAYKSTQYWSDYANYIYSMDYNGPANNEIWYTSADRKIVEPYDATGFDANIVSNTYENGQGVILFDSPVTSIGYQTFLQCYSLTSITIPDSVTSIGQEAFWNCSGLTSATIGNGVVSIEKEAFRLCSNLTSLTIPDSVTSIGQEAFNQCDGLTAFYGKYASEDNRCLIVDSVLESFARAGLTSYTIPDSVTSIGNCVFQECFGLTSVTIPGSVTSIGNSAFLYCVGLTSVTIPDSVTSIGNSAFYRCTGLTSITIPDSVISIGGYAFSECSSLTSVTIPDSVKSIGQYAFSGCTGLTSVFCKPTTPPIGYLSMFDSNASGRKIYVPNASVDAYKSARYWSSYASSIVGYEF